MKLIPLEIDRPEENEKPEVAPLEIIGLDGNQGMPATLDDIKKAKRDPLIPDMLERGGKMLFAAPAKAGKTWLALDLAVSLAKGRQWLGRDLTAHKVLYCDLELQEAKLNERLFAVARSGEGCDLPMTFRRLALRHRPEHRDRLNLFNRACAESADMGGADLIVLDCLYRFLGGLDENSSGDMAQLGAWIDQLAAETGSAILLIHHFGKGGGAGRDPLDRFRGSSGLAAEFDSLATLTAHEEEGHFILETVLRDFAPQPAQTLEFRFPFFWLSEKVPAQRKPGAPAKVNDDRILQAIPEGAGNAIGLSEIVSATGLSRSALQSRLMGLSGIEKTKEGQAWKYYR